MERQDRFFLGYHLKSGQWLSLQNRPMSATVRTNFFYRFSDG
jgi:hypothetical protein